jgi:hypothetical protein
VADEADFQWQADAEAKAHRWGLQLTSARPDDTPAIAGEMWLVRLDADDKPSAKPADWFPCRFGDSAALDALIQRVSGPPASEL